ncbi:single-stranded DNA-binding protein [Paenactinomyces guangxiensis]|uniref:Single-stranded DNA-binding protein n=1 Tax=Paenactinomyces guangxiensis TaxID=1490290 RepID=A0A7W1WQ90_9BACL|nr:single-stranded DNA-binding protein [Paenactinomyces guangxiensis]MBA4494093.1 single-stranded DNA-binding protein [Paenactinomyces guangxiensis]MBH8591162.1 single-stranded DNA-binding protein [Paenactinomyces guangxiensis]
MLNRVVLIGRLTRDPELRYTASGVAVAQFTLAVNRRFTNQQGEREADFINIVTWRNLAENCANYLKKGSLVGLEGRLQTGKYENQEGRTVYTTDVVADDVRFLESRNRSESPSDFRSGSFGGGNNYGSGTGYNQGKPMDDPFADDGKPIDISDDDLPF